MGGEIVTALRDARRALTSPDLGSICRAQEYLAAAETALRRAREFPAGMVSGWEGVRRELTILQDFVSGFEAFCAAALESEASTAHCVRATGACVSWSG